MSVFISYSRKDSAWLEELRTPLRFLENYYKIEFWDDTKFETGSKWRKEIDSYISQCKIAVLIVSNNFLASDFIINKELPDILERAEKNGLRIFTVIWDHCVFHATPISDYQTFNSPSQPLETISNQARKKILSNAAINIKEILEQEEHKTSILIPELTLPFSQQILIIMGFLSRQKQAVKISDISKYTNIQRKMVVNALNLLVEKEYIVKDHRIDSYLAEGVSKKKSSAYWRILPEGKLIVDHFTSNFNRALNSNT